MKEHEIINLVQGFIGTGQEIIEAKAQGKELGFQYENSLRRIRHVLDILGRHANHPAIKASIQALRTLYEQAVQQQQPSRYTDALE